MLCINVFLFVLLLCLLDFLWHCEHFVRAERAGYFVFLCFTSCALSVMVCLFVCTLGVIVRLCSLIAALPGCLL